jgi:hypothetical protein
VDLWASIIGPVLFRRRFSVRQRLQAEQGGVLYFGASEARFFGVPSAATVSIKSSLGRDLPVAVEGAPAGIDPFRAIVDQDYPAGSRRITVNVPIGINIGSDYLLTADDGEHVQIEVAAVNGTTRQVLMADGLPRDIPAGSLMRGVEIVYRLAGDQCLPPAVNGYLYRAVWDYVIGGEAYQSDQLFEVRARLLKPTMSEADALRLLPAPLAELEPIGGVQALRRAIDQAWGDVLDDLDREGFDPDLVMDAERLRSCHISRSLYRLGMRWGAAYAEWTKARGEDYAQQFKSALGSGGWYDKGQDSVQATTDTKGPAIALVR